MKLDPAPVARAAAAAVPAALEALCGYLRVPAISCDPATCNNFYLFHPFFKCHI